jgi:hypothetical protein
MVFTPIELAAVLAKQMEGRSQCDLHSSLKQGNHEAIDLSTQNLGRFKEPAMGIMPAALVDEPLLNEHRTDLGVEFPENASRLFRAQGVNLPLLFPFYASQARQRVRGEEREKKGEDPYEQDACRDRDPA